MLKTRKMRLKALMPKVSSALRSWQVAFGLGPWENRISRAIKTCAFFSFPEKWRLRPRAPKKNINHQSKIVYGALHIELIQQTSTLCIRSVRTWVFIRMAAHDPSAAVASCWVSTGISAWEAPSETHPSMGPMGPIHTWRASPKTTAICQEKRKSEKGLSWGNKRDDWKNFLEKSWKCIWSEYVCLTLWMFVSHVFIFEALRKPEFSRLSILPKLLAGVYVSMVFNSCPPVATPWTAPVPSNEDEAVLPCEASCHHPHLRNTGGQGHDPIDLPLGKVT